MNRICIKRLNRELENFYDKKFLNDISNTNITDFFDSLFINVIEEYNQYKTGEYHLIVEKNKNSNGTVYFDLLIPRDYPFKPYSVYRYNFADRQMKKNYTYDKYLYELGVKVANLNKEILEFFYIIY